MTPDQVAQLQEGDKVTYTHHSRPRHAVRGKVNQLMDNFIRVDWVVPFKNTYDILRRTSPLWAMIEPEPKA